MRKALHLSPRSDTLLLSSVKHSEKLNGTYTMKAMLSSKTHLALEEKKSL